MIVNQLAISWVGTILGSLCKIYDDDDDIWAKVDRGGDSMFLMMLMMLMMLILLMMLMILLVFEETQVLLWRCSNGGKVLQGSS